VRDVARVLAERGVNVEELESEVSSAPMSGDALFRARALLLVPAQLALSDLRGGLESLAGELMVDLAPV
jgi:glycine cleavage system regulatory protein